MPFSMSMLDPGQIIKYAYDEITNRIRVDAEVTATIGTVEVIITDVADSIKIGGGGPGPYLHINNDGSINVAGTSTVSGTVNTNLNGLASFQTTQYTVGTSAVQLTVTPLSGRSSMSIKVEAPSGQAVYVGNSSGVTTSTGYVLFNGDSLQLDMKGTQVVYAIGDGPGNTVYTLELA